MDSKASKTGGKTAAIGVGGLVTGLALNRPLTALVTGLALSGEPAPNVATSQPAATIQAATYPPLDEESWAFKSDATIYFVGKQSGRVVTTTLQPPAKSDNVRSNK